MASVIRLSRHRSVTRRDLPLDIPVGDSDLRPVAALLWIGSLGRVTLTIAHRQDFGVEATLALACVLVLPLLAWRSRHGHDTARQY